MPSGDLPPDPAAELAALRAADAALRAAGQRVDLDYGYAPRARPRPALHAALEPMLAAGAEEYGNLLARCMAHLPALLAIATRDDPDPEQPVWDNGWLPGFDALSIYGLLATTEPRRYVEVGSGNSTKFARRAIRDGGLRTRITSIDPQPRAEVDAICDRVIRQPCEAVDLAEFAALEPGDVLFVDNSHRAFQNSDVTVFFTEILPLLRPGVLYGLHDIFTPHDYPASWSGRWYNEQYLLECYLLGGAGGDRIVLPCAWLHSRPALTAIMDPLFTDPRVGPGLATGGAFWLQRAGTV